MEAAPHLKEKRVICFIAWSGERSKKYAAALRDFLGLVVQESKPWMSANIPGGAPWMSELQAALATAKIGILCVTAESSQSPWMHFEAGAIAAKLHATPETGSAVPLLCDGITTSQLQGPLAQLQVREMNRDGLLLIARKVNAFANSPLVEELLVRSFDAHWPSMQNALDAIASEPVPATPTRTQPQNDQLLLEALALANQIIARANSMWEALEQQHQRNAAFGDALRQYRGEGLLGHLARRPLMADPDPDLTPAPPTPSATRFGLAGALGAASESGGAPPAAPATDPQVAAKPKGLRRT